MRLPDPLAGLRLTNVARFVPGAPIPALPPAGTYLPDGGTRHALDLARRAGHSARVVGDLAVTLGALGASQRRAVLDPLGRRGDLDGSRGGTPVRPLRVGGGLARQTDGTTCGSADVGLLAAAGDPVLALWLVTGLRPGERPEGRERPGTGAGTGTRTGTGTGTGTGTADATARFRSLQQTVKRRTNRRALGPVPWPAALGTPPWGAARAARYADVRFTHRMVGAGAPIGSDPVLRAALDAASRGVPVPLFTGGDLGLGVATAVPRHVVLLTAADAPTRQVARWCWVYEPSSGTVHRLEAHHLLGAAPRDDVRRALGGWPHVCWALLPAGRAGGARVPAGGWTDPADVG